MMRKTMMTISKTLTNNVWLCVFLMIALIAAATIGWRWSLGAAKRSLSEDSIKILYQADNLNTESDNKSGNTHDTNTYDNMTVEIYNDQAYLYNQSGEVAFGPCKLIYDDLGYSNYNRVFRYVDKNGLIGFGKVEETGVVTVLYEGIFTEASKMADGSACVKENDEYYYIDDEGKRLTTGKYLEAYPFAESQGCSARVKKQDGSWAVINRKEEEILTGFDEIHELSYITHIGVGLKEGKPVIFTLEDYEDIHPGIICEFDGCSEINRPYPDADYVILKSKEGKQGVASVWNGNMIVPAVYEDIQWGYCDMKSDDIKQQMWFRCRKDDDTYDIHYWNN